MSYIKRCISRITRNKTKQKGDIHQIVESLRDTFPFIAVEEAEGELDLTGAIGCVIKNIKLIEEPNKREVWIYLEGDKELLMFSVKGFGRKTSFIKLISGKDA
jgi:hypothetical protein